MSEPDITQAEEDVEGHIHGGARMQGGVRQTEDESDTRDDALPEDGDDVGGHIHGGAR